MTRENEEETWKDVVGFEEFFQVSNHGNVFSKRTNRLLKTQLVGKGYSAFCSRLEGRSSKAICFKVHRLVATAFLPNETNLPQVNHKDGNKLNNHVDNLEWVTASANSIHAASTGLSYSPNVIDNGHTYPKNEKLSKEDVEYIRKVYKPYDKTFGARALARKYGVDHSNIHRAASGKQYVTNLLPDLGEDSDHTLPQPLQG